MLQNGHLRKGAVTCKCRENLVLGRFAGGVQGFLESVLGKGLGEHGKTFQLCQFCSRFWLDLYSWESSLSDGYLELHFISIDKLAGFFKNRRHAVLGEVSLAELLNVWQHAYCNKFSELQQHRLFQLHDNC
ncbi:hypothetical protein RHGRI_030571 [Rhododendron griersonianum]|uniref:Uncharacterized protein n=1 Tax=Rhododendron griersonianum TaxID=479676 RepID=A0AAV6INK5_9ERIC|nr:hypothetical protein RHGRI_030571 [Rhododendron griersonianum]